MLLKLPMRMREDQNNHENSGSSILNIKDKGRRAFRISTDIFNLISVHSQPFFPGYSPQIRADFRFLTRMVRRTRDSQKKLLEVPRAPELTGTTPEFPRAHVRDITDVGLGTLSEAI
ncbi:hypothetical protein KM043_012502 [Ampulex compressa]|nr:hypothetical protein KM043_012502 [Ampulex compressa]